ncbi:hypothetical protein ACFVOR_37150 [Streptomyces sp. NPDC057837]|uniref:hypothetical protein n=1 Tax=Streptomyces sp. NPDC057837 TaxID=3346260 RepID=UPI0036CA7C33
MASDTVPAAVPGPNDTPHSTAPTAPTTGTQQQPGGLAGLLAPVEPTRSAAFSLTPDPATNSPHADTVAGASSSAFSHTENPDTASPNSKNNSGGKQERSVIRAWLLAGAERWRKGGDARLKALDIKKAKAQARQVKENVTVNRAEKIAGGNTNSSSGNTSNSGKSLNNKASKKDSGSGQKNTPSPNSAGGGSRGNANGARKDSAGRGQGGSSGTRNNAGPTPGGRGTGTGSGSGSKGGGGRDRSSGDKGGTDHSGKDRHKPAKHQPSHAEKPSSSGGGGGGKPGQKNDSGAKPSPTGGKPGPQGPAGKPGKDPTDQHAPKPSKDTASGSKTPPNSSADAAGKDRKQPLNGTDRPGRKPNASTDQTNTRGPQPADKPGIDTNKPRNDKGLSKLTPAAHKPGAAKAPAPRIDLQKSRETGYRDGTRAAKVIAHTQAWRDGARDGYRDTTEAADREKQRLDKAHADRKNARTRAEDQPVTQPASSADYQQPVPPKPTQPPGPQPVTVTGTDTTHIHLGDNAARPSISRGEVRTLRRFQQRLDDKTTRMTLVAEATRTLEHHAKEQATKVTELLEQARAIEGGDKLVAALTKLQEAAQAQVDKAADVHKRAVRGQEACKTLKTNTDTRYGGIYQAVVDSPETSPAEHSYYREMADA